MMYYIYDITCGILVPFATRSRAVKFFNERPYDRIVFQKEEVSVSIVKIHSRTGEIFIKRAISKLQDEMTSSAMTIDTAYYLYDVTVQSLTPITAEMYCMLAPHLRMDEVLVMCSGINAKSSISLSKPLAMKDLGIFISKLSEYEGVKNK